MSGNEVKSASRAVLEQEIHAVEQKVRAALADLRSPFVNLVEARFEECLPVVRGAVVLTAGRALDASFEAGAAAGANGENDEKRIYLAAAIEMLRLAVAVHARLLPGPSGPGESDRSILGSTILAGDFCFSRAAGLAAKTDSPVVVDLFAHALQRVSEGYLRDVFHAAGKPQNSEDVAGYDVDRELILSGILAAHALLAGAEPLPEAIAAGDLRIGEALADAWAARSPQAVLAVADVAAAELPASRVAGWQAVAGWLAQARRNA